METDTGPDGPTVMVEREVSSLEELEALSAGPPFPRRRRGRVADGGVRSASGLTRDRAAGPRLLRSLQRSFLLVAGVKEGGPRGRSSGGNRSRRSDRESSRPTARACTRPASHRE